MELADLDTKTNEECKQVLRKATQPLTTSKRINQFIEKNQATQPPFALAFVDFKKAFDFEKLNQQLKS